MKQPRISLDDLYQEFLEPPRSHTIRPLWFWNGPLALEDVERQLEEMHSQGVFGAYIHCRSGLTPRYLSDDWWHLVSSAMRKAADLDFELCLADDFNWPSGEVRDFSLPGYPSHVLAMNTGFRMHSLVPVDGYEAGAEVVVCGQRTNGQLNVETLRLAGERDERADQEETLYSFVKKPTIGVDGGLVDLLNKEAMKTFISLVYDEYDRRLGDVLGSAFTGTFRDHEGDYGYRLAYTPTLWDEFLTRKGYDLRPLLPLLLEDGGRRTPVVRCDYFDVISSLYAEGCFSQVSEWARDHGIDVTGHTWEESLRAQAAFVGDQFRVQRALITPGVDSLFEHGRLAHHFMEARSVGHFQRIGLAVEHQGVQGADSYLSLERAKRTTNTIALWGATRFITHAFASSDRIEFPEDWFERQPWWSHFKTYADYVRRLSFMNSSGHHVCKLAVYYPIESIWANCEPCFSPELWDYTFSQGEDDFHGSRTHWGNAADEVDDGYIEILETLPIRNWDLDVIDDHFLAIAEVGQQALRIAEEAFSAIILPPMTCMRLSAARRIREFSHAGGLVIALRRLATDSMENGRNDELLQAELDAIDPIVVRDIPELLIVLETNLHNDVKVLSGPSDHLRVSHRVKDGYDTYWLVNDTDKGERYRIFLGTHGRPQLWNPDLGTRADAISRSVDEGTEIILSLGPWQGVYTVFDDGMADNWEEPAPTEAGVHPLLVLPIDKGWTVSIGGSATVGCYARSTVCDSGQGVTIGYHSPDFDDATWQDAWLSKERFTMREWWVVGPFDYEQYLGYNKVFPPEIAQTLDATYFGKSGPVRWRRHVSADRVFDLDAALSEFAAGSSGPFKTAFALSYVYSPSVIEGEFRITADSNAKVWINGHLILSDRDDDLGYLEMHDAYGYAVPIQLTPGWNKVLLKVSQGFRYFGRFGFVARFCSPDGHPIEGLLYSAEPDRRPQASKSGERWYRLPIPAGTTELTFAQPTGTWDVFINGLPVEASMPTEMDSVLAIRMPSQEHLRDFPVFSLSPTQRALGSLTATALAYYAGEIVYERTFELTKEAMETNLSLDLGNVGVAAEVWLNDVRVGGRPWRPFEFAISEAARVGSNDLRIVVSNTRSQERLRGPHETGLYSVPVRGPALRQGLYENGLIGPVSIATQPRHL